IEAARIGWRDSRVWPRWFGSSLAAAEAFTNAHSRQRPPQADLLVPAVILKCKSSAIGWTTAGAGLMWVNSLLRILKCPAARSPKRFQLRSATRMRAVSVLTAANVCSEQAGLAAFSILIQPVLD